MPSRETLRRWYDEANSFYKGVLLGTEEDARLNADPIMEVVAQNPAEALGFLRLVMLFGSLTGMLVTSPCVGYLALHWSPDHCGQMLQCLQRLTGGMGWRCSKGLSVLTYGWIVLGVIWLFTAQPCDTSPGMWQIMAAAIAVSVLRLLATFVSFWKSFPLDAQTAAATPALWERGATPEEIAALPLVVFSSKQNSRRRREAAAPDPRQLHRQSNKNAEAMQPLASRAFPRLRRGLSREGGDSSDQSQSEDAQDARAESGSVFSGCVICLTDFTEGDLLRVLPCGHRFDSACIDRWLMRSRCCPLCLRRLAFVGKVS